MLLAQSRVLLRCGGNVLPQAEADARRAQRPGVAVGKDRLVLVAWCTSQQRREQGGGLGPERTDPLLATLAQEPNLARGVEVYGGRCEVQDFVDPRTGVVEQG